MRATVVLALLAMTTLAGCADEPAPAPIEDEDPCLVERPGDFTCEELAQPGIDGTTAHLHDYWAGQEQLTIIDDQFVTGGTWFGDPIPWAEARPASEVVVPQGTAAVDVTITWPPAGPAEWYANPELWVKTAADNEPQLIGDAVSGETVTIETTVEDADLPHQVLSAWVFQWVVSVPDDVRPVSYSQDVHFEVVAHNGLEIPLYPGHPDRWNNETEFHLLDGSQMQVYQGDSTNGNWGCFAGCPIIYAPDDGVIVPADADRVEVTIELTYDTPLRLGLAYHGADTREFAYPAPADETGTTRTYSIDVGDQGDGPYAQQSLWQFTPYIEEPREKGITAQEYTITATVYRYAE